MPRRKIVQSLQNLSKIQVVETIKHIYRLKHINKYKDYFENIINKAKVNHQSSTLPHNNIINRQQCKLDICIVILVENLMDEVKKENSLNYHNIKLFLTPYLEKLDFTQENNLIIPKDVFRLILEECKSLVCLNLQNCRSIMVSGLRKLILTHTHLTTLKLNGTKANDYIMEMILKNCSSLTDLDVSFLPLTDACLTYLHPPEIVPVCQKLKVLDIQKTYISLEGIGMFLKVLPNLQMLHMVSNLTLNIIEVLRLIPEKDLKFKIQHVNLDLATELDVDSDRKLNNPNDDLILVRSFCPFLIKMELLNCDVHCLNELGKFDNLKELYLHCVANNNSDLISTLELCGQKLTILRLLVTSDMEVDVYHIGRCCPNIQNLSLRCSRMKIKNVMDLPHLPFQQVRELEIGSVLPHTYYFIHDSSQRITMEAVCFLLSYCTGVKILHLDRLSCLTHRTIMSILHENPLRNLEVLNLNKIPNLTPDILDTLIRHDKNKLREISISNCSLITENHYELWVKWIKDKNIDLSLSYNDNCYY